MNLVRPELLEQLLPLAVTWAEEQEERILETGKALSASQIADARQIGVASPQDVRLLTVPRIPLPKHPELRTAALAARLLTENTIGLTVRYGIFIRADCLADRRLVAHELVHTLQYERLGGVGPFMSAYLRECILPPGYPHGPLEQEAVRRSQCFG